MRMIIFASFFMIFAIALPGNAYRILGIFSYNGKSHFIMYEQLLKGLARRGHQVDVVSHFPLKKPFPNYNQIVNLAGTLRSMHNNVTYDFILENRKTSTPSLIATTFGSNFCDLMEQPGLKKLINNPPKDPPYDLLITDMMGAHCYLALGQHLKVPVVGVISTAMWPWANDIIGNPDYPAFIPSVLSEFDGQMDFWGRLRNTLELTKQKWEFNYYSTCQDEKIKKYIGPHGPSVREAERNVSLILTNSHYSLHGVRPYTTAVVEVGGLHIPENVDPLPNDLEKWLNDGEDGFVYISFGSMTKLESFPEETLRALYASIAKLSPIRVLMKIANSEELPPGLPDNVFTRPWISQLAVLKHKHIRAFVTHGGLMGTQEAVYYGVPMIGVPLFLDQIQNMKMYVRKHVAVTLNEDQLTEENWDSAFNSILRDPSYMKSIKKLSAEFRDRPMSAIDTATFWIEYVVRHGGANLKSPAMDLTWWQISLLDVYGALISAVVFTLYLFTFVINKLVAVISRRQDRLVNYKKLN